MTTYQQSSNNGTCTAGLCAEHFGWNQMAVASWVDIKPLALAIGTGYKITDYDRGPLVKGKLILSVDGETAISQSLSGSGTYWTYEDIAKRYMCQVPYGEAALFSLTIENLVFSYVTGYKSGVQKRVENVSLSVSDTFLFRQRSDTGSYGSETEKYLFWPWQKER